MPETAAGHADRVNEFKSAPKGILGQVRIQAAVLPFFYSEVIVSMGGDEIFLESNHLQVQQAYPQLSLAVIGLIFSFFLLS